LKKFGKNTRNLEEWERHKNRHPKRIKMDFEKIKNYLKEKKIKKRIKGY
jgi:hypothetical protein